MYLGSIANEYMDIIILGNTKDDIGTELEKLCRRLFEQIGLDNTALNVVKSGANEYDVIGRRKLEDNPAEYVQVIAECKAHRRKCDLPDFLKFLGKIYCQKLEHKRVEGYFVALSGINGNFLGAYESLHKYDDSVHLIVAEDLIAYIKQEFNLSDIQVIKQVIYSYTNRVIDSIDLALIDNKVYWIVRFNSLDYTIVSSDNQILTADDVEPISGLLANTYCNFIDLPRERARLQRELFVMGAILCIVLNNKASNIEEVSSVLKEKFQIHMLEFEQVLPKMKYVSKEFPLHIQIEDSRADFFRYLLSKCVFAETIKSTQYQDLIDASFVAEICEIQGGLILSDKEASQTIRILKLSYSAIKSVIYPNNFIANSIKNSSIVGIDKTKAVMRIAVATFNRMLIDGFNDDTHHQPNWTLMNNLGIEHYAISQHLTLNKGKKDEMEIDSTMHSRLVQLTGAPQNTIAPIVLFDDFCIAESSDKTGDD